MSDKAQLPAVRPLVGLLSTIGDSLTDNGLVEWEIRFKNGRKTLVGKTADGETLSAATYSGNGYSERRVSNTDRLTPTKRKREAKRMYRDGLTQAEIAERLGCSQKTVSNDLRT